LATPFQTPIGSTARAPDWDPLLDRGPSRLSVWVQLERIESSGSFIRDLTLAVIGRNEPPRIGLTAFMDERQPVSVIVSPADRPSAKPFASLFR
jgi:hypothetical protein